MGVELLAIRWEDLVGELGSFLFRNEEVGLVVPGAETRVVSRFP